MTQMEVRERRLGDRLLGGGADEFALGDAGLRQGEDSGGHRASVNLAQRPEAVERGQVAADGFDGDVVTSGELGDRHAPVTGDSIDDRPLTLLDVHAHPLDHSVRSDTRTPEQGITVRPIGHEGKGR